MRVISGIFGKRRLQTLKGQQTRPTADKIKGSLFSVLGGFFSGGRCLDYYGGSGALGIEAVSRGMDQAVICEQDRFAQAVIRKNIQLLGAEAADSFILLGGPNGRKVQQFKRQATDCQFDLVFLDPPYARQQMVKDIQHLLGLDLLTSGAKIVCEYDCGDTINWAELEGFDLVFDRTYGQTQLSILERTSE